MLRILGHNLKKKKRTKNIPDITLLPSPPSRGRCQDSTMSGCLRQRRPLVPMHGDSAALGNFSEDAERGLYSGNWNSAENHSEGHYYFPVYVFAAEWPTECAYYYYPPKWQPLRPWLLSLTPPNSYLKEELGYLRARTRVPRQILPPFPEGAPHTEKCLGDFSMSA